MNLFTKEQETHRPRKQLWFPKREGGGGYIRSLKLTCTHCYM